MQRNTDESEWTRFSRALSTSDSKPESESAAEIDETPTDSSPTTVAAAGVSEPRPDPPSAPGAPPEPIPVVPRPVIPPSANRTMISDDLVSVITEGTSVEGTFRSEHSIRILGTVHGEVTSSHTVTVEAQAVVNAKITAQHEVSIAGELNGEIFCGGPVTLSATGRVTGEISATSLVMEEGSFFEGHLKIVTPAAGQG